MSCADDTRSTHGCVFVTETQAPEKAHLGITHLYESRYWMKQEPKQEPTYSDFVPSYDPPIPRDDPTTTATLESPLELYQQRYLPRNLPGSCSSDFARPPSQAPDLMGSDEASGASSWGSGPPTHSGAALSPSPPRTASDSSCVASESVELPPNDRGDPPTSLGSTEVDCPNQLLATGGLHAELIALVNRNMEAIHQRLDELTVMQRREELARERLERNVGDIQAQLQLLQRSWGDQRAFPSQQEERATANQGAFGAPPNVAQSDPPPTLSQGGNSSHASMAAVPAVTVCTRLAPATTNDRRSQCPFIKANGSQCKNVLGSCMHDEKHPELVAAEKARLIEEHRDYSLTVPKEQREAGRKRKRKRKYRLPVDSLTEPETPVL